MVFCLLGSTGARTTTAWNVLNLTRMIISRSFMCCSTTFISKKEWKKKWPEEHRCIWHFWNVIQLKIGRKKKRRRWRWHTVGKRINWKRCISAKSSLHILTRRPYVCFVFGHASWYLYLYLYVCLLDSIVANIYLGLASFFLMQWRYFVVVVEKISFSDWYLLKFHCQRCELNCRALEHILNGQSYTLC